MSGAYTAVSAVLRRIDHLVQAEGMTCGNDIKDKVVQLRRMHATYDKDVEKQVIELAYDIEDAVEYSHNTAMQLKSIQTMKAGSIRRVLDQYCCLGVSCPLQEQLHKRINNLVNAYPDNDGGEEYSTTTTTPLGSMAIPRASSNPADEVLAEIVSQDREKLVKLLLEDKANSPKRSSCIAIVGVAGSGKTTLAKKVFNDPAVVSHFHCRAWATVSDDFQTTVVLRNMLDSLSPKLSREQIAQMETMELIKQLHKVQQKRKCLIVVDDIGSLEVWEALRMAIPQSAGTRVLMTTETELLANQLGGLKFRVRQWTKLETWEFFKIKSGMQDSDFEDPQVRMGVEDILTEIQGLPLLISLFANLFREHESVVLNPVMYTVQNQSVLNVISLSYDFLPLDLKPCFVYLGQFPRDQPIPLEKLYLMWIAEGLVSNRDTAERYMTELSARHLIVIEKQETDGQEMCSLHDLIHEICKNEGHEKEFSRLDSMHGPGRNKISLKHRVSIHLYTDHVKNGLSSYLAEAKNVRSLLLFGDTNVFLWWPQELFECTDFQGTRLLDFNGLSFEGNIKFFKNIDKLIYLRYLGFGDCFLEELPLACCNFPYLETLYLRVKDNCIMRIPNFLWKLTRLRFLYFPMQYRCGEAEEKLKLSGLTRLEIIENLDVSVCNSSDLQEFDNLQALSVTAHRNTMDFKNITNFIERNLQMHKSAVTFRNYDCYSKERRELLKKLLSCDGLHSLHLEGYIKKVPVNMAQNITEVVFDGSEFHKDPLPLLGGLPNLQKLSLCNDAFICKKICCSASSFPRLEILRLANLQYLETWLLEPGGMPVLVILRLEQCDKLATLPDEVIAMPTLSGLEIGSMPKAFEEEVKKIAKEQLALGNDKLSVSFYDC